MGDFPDLMYELMYAIQKSSKAWLPEASPSRLPEP
jgi:hypothetical protein